MAHLRGLPDCLIVVTREYATAPERVHVQAAWGGRSFAGRARMGLSLLHRPHDDLHRAAVYEAAATNHLRLATGDVVLHVRSRKPLQDVCSARFGSANQSAIAATT